MASPTQRSNPSLCYPDLLPPTTHARQVVISTQRRRDAEVSARKQNTVAFSPATNPNVLIPIRTLNRFSLRLSLRLCVSALKGFPPSSTTDCVLTLITLLSLLALSSCGYVGDPLPPLANVPARVADLAAIQRGSTVIVQFTVPSKTTESHPIPPPIELDLRAGTADHFEENQWAAAAQKFPAPEIKGPTARYELPAAAFAGKEIILGVRSASGRKQSSWSNFVILPIVAAPEVPADLAFTQEPKGLRLTWRGRGSTFRVFRKSADTPFARVAEVSAPEWTDPAAEIGKSYTYIVQSIVKLDSAKEAESDFSANFPVTPRDVFPPAAPQNLQGSTAPNSVELNWDRNLEDDLTGYRIYRAEGDAAFEKLADVSAIPSYSDRKAAAGKTYRYQVTALDQAGNESPRSAPVTVIMP